MPYVIRKIIKIGNSFYCSIPASKIRETGIEYLFGTMKSVPVEVHTTKSGVFINLANPVLKGQAKLKWIELHQKEREVLSELLQTQTE